MKMRPPNWKDPRWTLLVFLFGFVIYAVLSPGFHRTPAQCAAAVLTCVGLDLFLIRFYKKVSLFPLSAIITSCGTVLLTDSPYIWPYALVGAIAILSKHFITINGRHVFNPNNFGVVVALLFCSSDITVDAGRWGGSTTGAILIFVLGVLVAIRAKKVPLAIAYAGTFLVGAYIRAQIFGRAFMIVAAPITGAAFQLFLFYMISDPKTSPRSKWGQVIFGILLSGLDSFLRFNSVKYAPFYGLFIMTAFYATVVPIDGKEGHLSKFKNLFRQGPIRPPPWSVAIVALIAFAAGFSIGPLYYKKKVILQYKRVESLFTESRASALPLNNPDAVSVAMATHMRDSDLVFGIVVEGHPRAYPRWLMIGYHIANDTIEGVPVFVVQCEVCSSAAAFIPTLTEAPYGPLVFTICGYYGGTFQMCDNFTNSRWRPFAGVAFDGPLKGQKMEQRIPVEIRTWAEWKRRYPDTDVVFASENVRKRPHSHGARFNIGASFIPKKMAATADLSDKRLPDNALVFGLFDGKGGEAVALPLDRIGSKGLVYSFPDANVIVAKQGEYSVVGFICPGKSQCGVRSQNPLLFENNQGGIWDEFGRATAESKIKKYLDPADGYFAEWYEWVNTHSNSKIYGTE